jgi:HEAT repeats
MTASVPTNGTDWSRRFSWSPRPTRNPAARAQAIAALVELRVDGSVDLALAALRDPDWGMRLIVGSQMGPTGDPRVVDALVVLLNDADGYAREGAAIGLERQGDPGPWNRCVPCCAGGNGTERPRRAPNERSAC